MSKEEQLFCRIDWTDKPSGMFRMRLYRENIKRIILDTKFGSHQMALEKVCEFCENDNWQLMWHIRKEDWNKQQLREHWCYRMGVEV